MIKMKIPIKDIDGQIHFFSLKNTTAIQNGSLKLILDNELEQHYNSFHIDFLILCDLFYPDTTFENALIAFYCSDGYLKPYLISELPKRLNAQQPVGFVVNFDKYIENCKLLKENTLSFREYIDQVKDDDSYLNSIILDLKKTV